MKQLVRFSISGFLGVMITAALFIGMLSLLNMKKPIAKSQNFDINFSFVQDYEAPDIDKPPKKEPPKKEEISQQPSMNPLALEPVDTPTVAIDDMGTIGKNFNVLENLGLPNVGFDGSGLTQGNSGGIQAAIAPMYPPEALTKKVEGWVQVLIDVNEFGQVASAKVINAKPARIFNAAAIKAVRKWKFHPKTIDGKAVSFKVTQTIEFELDQ